MRVIFSEKQDQQGGIAVQSGGEFETQFDTRSWIELVSRALKEQGHNAPEAPEEHGLDVAGQVHEADYLTFLETAWDRWVAAGHDGEAFAIRSSRRGAGQQVPDEIVGALGYYSRDASSSISGETWGAARNSMDCAMSGANLLAEGVRSVFALCHPAGHHAGRNFYWAECFLNNAGIATQHLRNYGAERVAVLDVGFRHGDGTQDLFYERNDVFVASIHGQSDDALYHFAGETDKAGAGVGEGFNLNLPLPKSAAYDQWVDALHLALASFKTVGVEALVVSLGVDTYDRDPAGFFKLTSDDFKRYGSVIAGLRVPTLFCMEGGHAVPKIGLNAVNVLSGFEGA